MFCMLCCCVAVPFTLLLCCCCLRMCAHRARVRACLACVPGVLLVPRAARAPAAAASSSSLWRWRRPAASCPLHHWARPLMQVRAAGERYPPHYQLCGQG